MPRRSKSKSRKSRKIQSLKRKLKSLSRRLRSRSPRRIVLVRRSPRFYPYRDTMEENRLRNELAQERNKSSASYERLRKEKNALQERIGTLTGTSGV